jgi:hypothetical protein
MVSVNLVITDDKIERLAGEIRDFGAHLKYIGKGALIDLMKCEFG